MQAGTAAVYTHKKFEISYNGNRVVMADITPEAKKEIVPGVEYSFTYEVTWKQSEVDFSKRFERYLDPSFFQHRVCLYIFSSIKKYFHRFTGSPYSIPS